MNNESNIGGISVRAIIVLFLILVFGASVFLKINSESLNSVVMAVIGWYFGQKTSTSSTATSTTDTTYICPTCSKTNSIDPTSKPTVP